MSHPFFAFCEYTAEENFFPMHDLTTGTPLTLTHLPSFYYTLIHRTFAGRRLTVFKMCSYMHNYVSLVAPESTA